MGATNEVVVETDEVVVASIDVVSGGMVVVTPPCVAGSPQAARRVEATSSMTVRLAVLAFNAGPVW